MIFANCVAGNMFILCQTTSDAGENIQVSIEYNHIAGTQHRHQHICSDCGTQIIVDCTDDSGSLGICTDQAFNIDYGQHSFSLSLDDLIPVFACMNPALQQINVFTYGQHAPAISGADLAIRLQEYDGFTQLIAPHITTTVLHI